MIFFYSLFIAKNIFTIPLPIPLDKLIALKSSEASRKPSIIEGKMGQLKAKAIFFMAFKFSPKFSNSAEHFLMKSCIIVKS